MKKVIIDIGSNSMRQTLYEVSDGSFQILFRKKFMAGLAGYVKKENLTNEGIERAITGLKDFKQTQQLLNIDNSDVSIFATASLRNIRNTEDVQARILSETGYNVEILSGEQEAYLGYTGAMQEVPADSGAFVDIGGASTEIVSFDKNKVRRDSSFPVGSLNLYKKCVKHILPSEKSLKKIEKTITDQIDKDYLYLFDKRSPLICVGGTSRAVLKIAKRRYDLPEDCNTITGEQFKELSHYLMSGKEEIKDVILKLEPDRIHTLIPGIAILHHIYKLFDAKELIVSSYGVREGYLCQKLM
ncbi:MAG: hypothetical protein ACOYJJ_08635 [Anaerovoracaceae bacterium]|jgi:exopolyphosphatase/guanosine-5'-triphosphate,3'-diphosphate pyrophosphatase